MDTELKDLCAAVYGLTGWRLPVSERPVEYWVQHDDDWDLEYGIAGMPVDGGIIPLYNSDYLLEKLKECELTVILRWNRDMKRTIAMQQWNGKWCVGTFDMPQGDYPIADTALKALLKLTLALHEANLLPPNNQNLSKGEIEMDTRENISLHRAQAHLAGRIEEAMSIKIAYTSKSHNVVLNGVLDKRIKRYRRQLKKLFAQQCPAKHLTKEGEVK